MPNGITMHMYGSVTIYLSVVLYNAIVNYRILIDAYNHVHVLKLYACRPVEPVEWEPVFT